MVESVGLGVWTSVSHVSPWSAKEKAEASGSAPEISSSPMTPVAGGSKLASSVTFECRLTSSFCLFCIVSFSLLLIVVLVLSSCFLFVVE